MHATSIQPALVSKAEYARLKGVSKPRVSQWVSEGKIGREALVGEGPTAKVNVAVADAHLNRNLDISQRLGNGLSTRLSASSAPAQPIIPGVETVAPPIAVAADPIEEQIKREKLEGLQRENRKRAEEEAARAGRYVETQAVRQEMAKIAAQTVTIVEGALPQIAAALAEKFAIPQRDVLHLLRNEFWSIRSSAAATLKAEALSLRETVEVDIESTASESPEGLSE